MDNHGWLTPTLQFISLAEIAQAIQDVPTASWEDKYDLLFYGGHLEAVQKTGVKFELHDPDSSYEEDVRAYVQALTQKAQSLRQIVFAIPGFPGIPGIPGIREGV